MNDYVTQVLTQITIALVGLAASYLMYLINRAKKKLEAETEKIKDEKQRALVKDAINQVNTVIAKTVTQFEQTTAKTLRENVKDGIANRTQLLNLADEVFTETMRIIKPEYKSLLGQELGDLNKYITNTIEEKVFEIKNFGTCSYN